MGAKTKQSVFNLLGVGEDSYAGQNAQNPRTSRRLWSWIPQDDGQLHRELPEPLFLPQQLSGEVCGLYEYDRNNGDGTITRSYFAAARTSFAGGTKPCNFYMVVGGAWNLVPQVGTLADAPQCRTFQNLFNLSDGATNWIFDGTTWVTTGFKLLPGACTSTATTTFPVGTNGPAIIVNQPANIGPVITGNVTAKFYSGAGMQGGMGLFFPLGAALATATGNSLMFNPVQLTGIEDPDVQPLQWATLNSSGVITGYTTPYAGATQGYCMVVTANIIIQKAGTYNVILGHDDGAIWGISNGLVSGLPPTASGPFVDAYNHQQTALNGYGGSAGGVLCGGTNKSARVAPGYDDAFSVTFPQADTYTFEIDYTNWQNEQRLVLAMALAPGMPTVIPPSTGTPQAGIDAAIGRQYWVTMADETSGRGTESDTSPPSVTTGPLTAGSAKVYPLGGNFTTSASINVTVATDTLLGAPLSDGTDGQLSYILGKFLYINGTLIGTIAGYTTTGAQNYLASIQLTTSYTGATITAGYAVICDRRTTHWHLYASESDGSQIGQFLATVPITQNLFTTPYVDSSPFLDDVKNLFLPIFRPVRNDPPPFSKLLEIHKSRLWRRRESAPNFFNYTANEEVASGDNGDPTECVPGADKNTLSDLVNEVSFPTESTRIRALLSHAEALYMFSEKQCYPLYGQSYDDFAISQVTAFSLGIAGRFAGKSTPHGLPFLSYDCKGYLYPVVSTIWDLTPQANATEALVEIGKPMRNVFKTITKSRLDEVYTEHYFFGIRDWWVVTFPIA